jgi:hypothetical protein
MTRFCQGQSGYQVNSSFRASQIDSIILIRIINQSIIANLKQQCNNKQNNTNFMVKNFKVFLLFTKVLLHLIQRADVV